MRYLSKRSTSSQEVSEGNLLGTAQTVLLGWVKRQRNPTYKGDIGYRERSRNPPGKGNGK
jgi:hypothetical protein